MNPNEVTAVLFLAIGFGSAAILLLCRDLVLGMVQRGHGDGAMLQTLPRMEAPASRSPIARFDHWFERTLYLSGLGLKPVGGVLLLTLASLVTGGFAFVMTESAVVSVLFSGLGVTLTFAFINIAKRRRVKKFLHQFPSALDLLARAVRAGESLDQAIDVVADSTSEPVATEFKRCAKQLELGLSVSATTQAFSQRMGLLDVRIFSTTLSVHRDAGGNLAETLERLAAVIRERIAYQRQLKAMTSAGRFSAIFIAAMGPILFAYLFLLQPEYGRSLWEDPTGKTMLIFAAVSELVGLACVARILKSDL